MSVRGVSPQVLNSLRRSVNFAGLPAQVLEEIVARFNWMEVTAETVVCREGQPGDELYVIDRGHFVVEGRLGGESVRFPTSAQAMFLARWPC